MRYVRAPVATLLLLVAVPLLLLAVACMMAADWLTPGTTDGLLD